MAERFISDFLSAVGKLKKKTQNSEKYMKFLFESIVHTYIHIYIIGHYKPSVMIIDLVSHTTLCGVC